MPKPSIYIQSFGSISPLGSNEDEIWDSYLSQKPLISSKRFNNQLEFVAQLTEKSKKQIEDLKEENSKYKSLDNSVLYALLASRKAFKSTTWKRSDFGVNIGSSRGATQLFEDYYKEFSTTGKAHPLTSPSTTLGNISSWVLQDLKASGIELNHSITCSTALHGLLNAMAWLKSGMSNSFLVGGSEAPLTPFTIAQMKAVKLYAEYNSTEKFPNQSLALNKEKNTMILGEGAASFCLSIEKENSVAKIVGVGYASEKIEHGASLSAEAECLQNSMKMALNNAQLDQVDAIIMHAPGTIKGDLAEVKAIKKVFGKELPLLTSNKFWIGHTFGASGALSLEMALLMLKNNQFIENPLYKNKQRTTKDLNTVMVNAVGFGGNAVSVIVSTNY